MLTLLCLVKHFARQIIDELNSEDIDILIEIEGMIEKYRRQRRNGQQ